MPLLPRPCLGSAEGILARQWSPALSGLTRCSNLEKCHTPISARGAFFERFYRIATTPAAGSLLQIQHEQSRQVRAKSLGRAQQRSLRTGEPRMKRIPRGQPTTRRSRQGRLPGVVRIPFGTISQEELNSILRYSVPADQGNAILRTLHERRANGSLIEYGHHMQDAPEVPPEVFENALSWLREKFPLDEKMAATVWLGREMDKLEKTYIDRAERLGLYKKDNVRERPAEQSTANTSNSVLEEFKKYHERRREREAKEEEARKQTPEYKAQEELRVAKVEEAKEKQLIWEEKLAERKALLAKQGMVSEEQEIPDISMARRLVPSTIFSLAFVGACYWYAQNYEPVSQEDRIFPMLPVSVTTVLVLMAMNVSVTALWFVPICQRTFNKFLMSVPGKPYAVSMLGNIFSHQRFRHLSANMLTLVLFGVTVHEEIGRGNFLALYLSGGVLGSMCSLWYFIVRGILHTSHCGASGGTWAVMAAWACLTLTNPPRSPESMDFASDVMRYMVIFIQLLSHLRGDIMQTVDVVAHATGALTGLSVAWNLRQGSVPARPAPARAPAEAEASGDQKQDDAPVSKADVRPVVGTSASDDQHAGQPQPAKSWWSPWSK